MAECENKEIVVFDVGGHHIAGGVFNIRTGMLQAWKSLRVVAHLEGNRFVDAIGSLACALIPKDVPTGVAIAMPSPFDYERGISYMRHKYQQLYGIDLRRALSDKLGCNPLKIVFLKDASAFTLGELYQGAAVGATRAIGITLGTGIGSAFAIDGEVVLSGPGVPPGGEIWNIPYRRAIVESFVSTVSIQRQYAQRTLGQTLEVSEIAELARTDSVAADVFSEFGRELGRVLRHTCQAFTPECIVLGGGISRSSWAFLNQVNDEIGSGIQLHVSTLFDRASLIGAGVEWARKQDGLIVGVPEGVPTE